MTVTTIALRRDTAIDWTNANPILALGEAGIETDTLKMKVGDGASHWAALDYLVGGSAPATGLNVLDYGAVGDGVTDDTAAIQATINAASTAYLATGQISTVTLPGGYRFLTAQQTVKSGMYLWAYGATILPKSSWTSHGLLYYPNNTTPQILANFGIFGGHWVGSGTENSTTNQMVFQNGLATGVQDFIARDMLITNWGATSLYPRNATRAKVLNNTILCNGINNSGFQNEVTFDYDSGAAASGEILVAGNHIHNATADAIAVVVLSTGPANLAVRFTVVDNIITADPPTADASCGFTNGSATVTDTSASTANVGRFVTASITGLASPIYILSAVAGVSYTLSKNFTGTTGSGTLYVGVYKNTIKLEIDGANNVSDVLFANNNVTGYEREQIGFATASGAITKARASNNILTNGQLNAQYGTGSVPQGTCIQIHANAGVTNNIDVTNNTLTVASSVAPISVFATNLTNNGIVAGNKFTTDPAQGQAVLVGGTVTVSTTEVRTGDNIILTNVLAGGTLGSLSVGTITNATSFTITSSSATDTSTVYWKIDH